MIRVIYKWKVKPGGEEAFAEAWSKATRAIAAKVSGARGSLLLRSRKDPSEFTAVARWDSLEAWTAARASGSAPPDPEAIKVMRETAGDVVSADFYDELDDLTDTSI